MKVTIGEREFDALTTVENADIYLAGDVARSAGWALRQPDAKGRGIVSATRLMLDLPWCEGKVPDPAADELPAAVEEVAAMLAADLLAKPRLFADASGSSNVKIAKAGSAQVEFFAPVDGGPLIPMALWRKLLGAGLVCTGADDDGGSAGAYVSGISGDCRPLDGRYADYCREGWLAEDRD
jgi:hypothetical protein